jgi:homopolymeric O-antigen transport system permease protein
MSLPVEAAAVSKSTGADQSFVIDAARPARWFDWREVWRYRELIWTLAARDIKVRYRQALVGMAWIILQPLIQVAIFSSLFGRLIEEQGDTVAAATGVPYEVSTFCGLLFWTLFATIVSSATGCLVDYRHLLTKVYFPRIVLPLAACLRPLVDFGVGLAVLIVVMAWYRVVPTVALLALPGVVLLTVLAALSLGLWLSALNAHYRDFGIVVPFALQMGFFISPVVYETSRLISTDWRWLYGLNPMASLLEAARWCVLGTRGPGMIEVLMSVLATLLVLLTGEWYFRRVERFLADRI